jgi:hypothetical protein
MPTDLILLFPEICEFASDTSSRRIDFDMSSAEATVRSVPLADVGGPGAKSPAANSARQISGLERPACGAGSLMCCQACAENFAFDGGG